jgi:hypothetical protein
MDKKKASVVYPNPRKIRKFWPNPKQTFGFESSYCHKNKNNSEKSEVKHLKSWKRKKCSVFFHNKTFCFVLQAPEYMKLFYAAV